MRHTFTYRTAYTSTINTAITIKIKKTSIKFTYDFTHLVIFVYRNNLKWKIIEKKNISSKRKVYMP